MKRIFYLLMILVAFLVMACEKSEFYDEEPEKQTETPSGGSGSANVNDTTKTNDKDSVGLDDENEPYEETDITDGNETHEINTGDTVSVHDFIHAKRMPGVYVVGYIVGDCTQSYTKAELTPPFTMPQAILLADKKDETSMDEIISIQLPSKSNARNDLNLVDHPENYHKRLMLYGNRTIYLGITGIKQLGKNYWLLE